VLIFAQNIALFIGLHEHKLLPDPGRDTHKHNQEFSILSKLRWLDGYTARPQNFKSDSLVEEGTRRG
jgi:hypothetical protein